jgi:hypothetical protein
MKIREVHDASHGKSVEEAKKVDGGILGDGQVHALVRMRDF